MRSPGFQLTEVEVPGGSFISLREYAPETRHEATIVLLHGWRSSAARLDWACRGLADVGHRVLAPELASLVRSEASLQKPDLAGSISTLLHIVQHAGDAPTFLLGQGIGAAIATLFGIEHARLISGLICQSMAHEVVPPEFALALLKGRSAPVPDLRVRSSDLSRDPKLVAEVDADPELREERLSESELAASVLVDDRLRREIRSLRGPLLVQHGSGDRIASAQKSLELFERAVSADRTTKIYDGAAHDLLNDFCRREVLADLVGWVRAQVNTPTPVPVG